MNETLHVAIGTLTGPGLSRPRCPDKTTYMVMLISPILMPLLSIRPACMFLRTSRDMSSLLRWRVALQKLDRQGQLAYNSHQQWCRNIWHFSHASRGDSVLWLLLAET
jgi:hypothetical protein